MRIRVGYGLCFNQSALLRQQSNNLRVCIKNILSSEKFGIRIEYTVGINRICNLQTVLGAYNIVIHTVTWSSVHRTGTGIGSYMRSQYNRHIKIQERMFETLQFQFTSPAAADNLIIGYSGSCQRFLMKNFGINQLFRIFTVNLNQYIFKVRIKTNSSVCRKSPRSCCPDYY